MKNIFIAVIIWAIFLTSLYAADKKESENKEPAALTVARKAYQTQTNSALDPNKKKYIAQLEELKKTIGGKGDLEGAGAVQKEIDSVSGKKPMNTESSDRIKSTDIGTFNGHYSYKYINGHTREIDVADGRITITASSLGGTGFSNSNSMSN